MRNRLPALIAVIAAIVAVAAALWLALSPGDAESDPAPEAPSAGAGAAPALSDGERDALRDLAVRFETRTREWGVDPAAASADALAQSDTDTLLKAVRTPDALDADLSDVSSIAPDADAGPHAPSEACTADPAGAACSMWPDMLSWWRAHHWTMGARLDGEPEVTVNADGTVDVTGRVRVVLWTSGLDATRIRTRDGTSWWAYTPVTGLADYHDTLTVTDGLVSKRVQHSPTIWLADPLLSAWDDDPAAGTMSWAERSQPSIPIRGDAPDDPEGLSPDPDHLMVANAPGTDGPLWETVPDVDTRYGSDAPQQDPSWSPEDDAATLRDREAAFG